MDSIRNEKGHFIPGHKPLTGGGRPNDKQSWITVFNRCYTHEDFEMCIEVLKECVLKEKSWAVKLVMDKLIPDKLEVSGNVETDVNTAKLEEAIRQVKQHLAQ